MNDRPRCISPTKRFAATILLFSAAGLVPAADAVATPSRPQDDGRGWAITGQGGAGLTFVFGEQVPDPAVGLAVGRYLTDRLEVSGQLIVFASPARTTRWATTLDRDTPAIRGVRERRRSALALTRVNLFLGGGRWRPYFAFGAGLGWGSERIESRLFLASTASHPAAGLSGTDEPVGNPIPGFDRNTTIERVGFATLLGTGMDITLRDRWSLRPEVSMPFVWNGVGSGNVTMVIGLTYSTAPPHRVPDRDHYRGAEVPRAPSDLQSWDSVAVLPPAETLRVVLDDGAIGWREGGNLGEPDDQVLIGTFVAADEESIVLRIVQGADPLIWRFPSAVVESVERGHLVADPPWEGVLSGLVLGAGIGAIGYLGSGGGDDHEIWIPVGTALFGGPMALAGGLLDHFHKSFEPRELVYRRLARGRR